MILKSIRVEYIFYSVLFLNIILADFRPLELFIPVLLMIAIVRIIEMKGKIVIPTTFRVPIALLSVVVFIGFVSALLFIGEFSLFPIKAIIRYSSYLIVVLIVLNSRLSSRTFLRLIVVIVFLSFFFTLLQYFVLDSKRPGAFYSHSNHMAYFLTFANIILLYNQHLFKKRTMLYLATFAVFTSIILSRSMGGAITFLFFVGYYIFFSLRSKTLKVVGVIVLFIALFLSYGLLQTRISDFSDINKDFVLSRITTGNAGGSNSLVWRLVTWSLIIRETIDNDNFIFGNGLDSTSPYSPYFLDVIKHDPHNSYVRVLAESGLVGLFLYLLTLFWVFQKLRMRRSMTTSVNNDGLSLSGGFVLFYVFLIAQLSGNIIVNPVHMWLILIYITCVLKPCRI